MLGFKYVLIALVLLFLVNVEAQPFRPQLFCDCSSWVCNGYARSSTVIPADAVVECSYVQALDYTEAGYWDTGNRLTISQLQLNYYYLALNGYGQSPTARMNEALLEYFGGAYYFDADSAPICGCPDDECDFRGGLWPCDYDGALYNVIQTSIDYFDGNCPLGQSNTFSLQRTWTRASCAFNLPGFYSLTQTITFQDTIPPELFVPENMVVECTADIINLYPIEDYLDERFGSARATDLCTYPKLTQDLTLLSSDECASTYRRTWSAHDGCNSISDSQIVTIVDSTPPTLYSLYGEDVFELDCTVMDDVDSPAFYSNYIPLVFDTCDSTPTSPAYDDEDFNGQTKCVDDGSMTRTWTSADNCGNVGYYTQTYYFRDRSPPFDSNNVQLVDHYTPGVSCGLGDVPFATYNFVDDCSSFVYASYTDSIIGDKNIYQEVVRQYTVEDGCGNSVSFADHYFFSEESFVQNFGFGTSTTVDHILNAQKGVNIPIPFILQIQICGPTYLVFDIGPAIFVSTDASISCQPLQGVTGLIVCPLVVDLNAATRTLTINVPTSYQPDNLEISGNIYLSDGFQYNTGYNDDLTASLVLSFY